MKLTNRLNLPAPLVAAILNDDYDDGGADYSTTSLIKPPRILALSRGNKERMTEDASDRIWALLGKVTHKILEQAGGGKSETVEKRMFAEISGKRISGQVDLLYDGTSLEDWKLTTIYKAKNGTPDEWIQQMNINRYLFHYNHKPVEKLGITAIYRDWSIMMADRRSKDYPPDNVERFDIPVWPLDGALEFIMERIRLHESAKMELPECTSEERWQDPEMWAVMQKGRKRALKLYDDYDRATAVLKQTPGKGLRIEHRPSVPKRCKFFCSCLPFCRQGQELLRG